MLHVCTWSIQCAGQTLDLGGNVPSAEGLLVLIRAIYSFHQRVPTCQLHLGGVAGAAFSETMAVQVANMPLAQENPHTVFETVVLRRQKLLVAGNTPAAIIVAQIRCKPVCWDIHETICMVEEVCSASPGQLAVLAQSTIRQQQQHSTAHKNYILYLRALEAGRHSERLTTKPHQIAACIEELATENHPSLSTLYITRVFLPELHMELADTGISLCESRAFRPLSQQLISVAANKSADSAANLYDNEGNAAALKPIGRLQMTVDIRPLTQNVEYWPSLAPEVLPVANRRASTHAPTYRQTTYHQQISAVIEDATNDTEAEIAPGNATTPQPDDAAAIRETEATPSSAATSSNAVVRAVRQLVHEGVMCESDASIWYGLVGEESAQPVLESLYQQGTCLNADYWK